VNLSAQRATTRIARRNIARHRGRSALIALLVLLPVAAMVAAISILRTTTPTKDMLDASRMGRADLLAQVGTEEELHGYLPAGSIVEPMVQAQGRIVLEGARPTVALRAMRVDGLAQGILTLVEGRVPHGSGEAAITRPVAKLAGVSIGSSLTLDGRPQLTVVGFVENPMFLEERAVVVEPGSIEMEAESQEWLIDVPDGADPDAIVAATYLPGTDVQQIGLMSRNIGLFPPGEDTYGSTVLVFGALALLEAALIASAAFSVSIRRRQRELGLLAAVGASTRQIAATVVAEAAVLGAVACAGGVVVGVAIAVALEPWLDDLTGHRNRPLVIDAAGLAGPVAIGFLAALIAAIAPARTVARIPVLRALSGRRPPEASARATLLLGLLFIAVASAMTIGGATMREDTGSAHVLLMMGGAVLGTLGFGACSPWLLERLEVLAARLPLAGRLAFRDTARARSRSSPIVTAILSSLAALVAIGGWAATNAASELQYWKPELYPDQVVLFGSDPRSAARDLLEEDGVLSAATVPNLYPRGAQDSYLYVELVDARHPDGSLVNLYERCSNCGDEFAPPRVGDMAAGTPELLSMAHAEDAASDLREGRLVVLTTEPMSATKAVVKEEVVEGDAMVIKERMTLDVRLIQVPVGSGLLPDAFVPDAAIAELRLAPIDDAIGDPIIVRYDHAVTDADLARARQIAGRYPDIVAQIGTVPPSQQGEGFRILLIALVLLFAVSVTGIAIALGEAESRPEQRSLLALGADPGLRRRIAAARAAVLALLAGLLAVPAGLLPIWGVFTSREAILAIPLPEIMAVVIVLPIVAVASAWLLSRPIPDWNAFRNVRPGE
jgi:putative ABC transport system permease protein